MSEKVRVRFAPSPTGFLHLGNVRAALINYLFAKQKGGNFVLRIEDTDVSRNIDEAGMQIIKDLRWLGIEYDEGPFAGEGETVTVMGKYGPYFQSQRKLIYEKYLEELVENEKVYRCFCSKERLEKLREEQLENGLPPRYDGYCRHLSDDQIKLLLAEKKPFVWRLKVNPEEVVEIEDMARGKISFDMKNFSDFALTRSDGSFTFMFTNFIDDWLMKITHVIRGEDHLTNSAMQGVLFEAFAAPLPKFWHLPMLCNVDGAKLSKRDFGFSLRDLQQEGILREAICNYLAIIGSSFKSEIMSLQQLIKNFDFEHLHSTGPIKFDMDKLLWVNHEWIKRLNLKELEKRVRPFLLEKYEEISHMPVEQLIFFLSKTREEAKTLHDFKFLLEFYFVAPQIDKRVLLEHIGSEERLKELANVVKANLFEVERPEIFVKMLKESGYMPSQIFKFVRYFLTGKVKGMSVHDLVEILGKEKTLERLRKIDLFY